MAQLRPGRTYSFDFEQSAGANLFPDQPDGQIGALLLSDFMDPNFDLFNVAPGGLFSGAAQATLDGGFYFNLPGQEQVASVSMGSAFTFDGALTPGNDGKVVFSFLPGAMRGTLTGALFGPKFEVEAGLDLSVAYQDLAIDFPWITGLPDIDLGSGTLDLEEILGEPLRVTVFETPPTEVQIVLFENFVDLILNPPERKTFTVSGSNEVRTGDTFDTDVNTGSLADAYAPVITGAVKTVPLADGQVDLDSLLQTLVEIGAGAIASGGLAVPAILEKIALKGTTEYLEIGLVDTLVDTFSPGGAVDKDEVEDLLDNLPFFGDAELTIFDMVATLGL